MRPSIEKVEELMNECIDLENDTKFSGMTFEQGIIAALEWYLEGGDYPLEE